MKKSISIILIIAMTLSTALVQAETQERTQSSIQITTTSGQVKTYESQADVLEGVDKGEIRIEDLNAALEILQKGLRKQAIKNYVGHTTVALSIVTLFLLMGRGRYMEAKYGTGSAEHARSMRQLVVGIPLSIASVTAGIALLSTYERDLLQAQITELRQIMTTAQALEQSL